MVISVPTFLYPLGHIKKYHLGDNKLQHLRLYEKQHDCG